MFFFFFFFSVVTSFQDNQPLFWNDALAWVILHNSPSFPAIVKFRITFRVSPAFTAAGDERGE